MRPLVGRTFEVIMEELSKDTPKYDVILSLIDQIDEFINLIDKDQRMRKIRIHIKALQIAEDTVDKLICFYGVSESGDELIDEIERYKKDLIVEIDRKLMPYATIQDVMINNDEW